MTQISNNSVNSKARLFFDLKIAHSTTTTTTTQ